jgi:hypothetical protein
MSIKPLILGSAAQILVDDQWAHPIKAVFRLIIFEIVIAAEVSIYEWILWINQWGNNPVI